MAGNPSIVVRIAANVREFLSGTDLVERALVDLGDESGDVARDVERDTDRMVDAFRDAARKVESSSKDAGRSVKKGFADPAKESGAEAGKEVGSEFAANLSESLASGDLSAIGSDTAAGLVAGFAGIGGPIGIALAGAAVPITAFFLNIRKQSEQTKEQVTAVFSLLKESAGKLNEEFLRARFDEIWNADPSKWREIRDLLVDAGLSSGTVRDAIVGTDKATEKVQRRYEQLLTKAQEAARVALVTTGAESDRAREVERTATAQAEAAKEVLKQNGYLEAGRTEYETFAETRERGLDLERKRTRELKKQLETLQALKREATGTSPAAARIAQGISDNRASRPGGGQRTPSKGFQ